MFESPALLSLYRKWGNIQFRERKVAVNLNPSWRALALQLAWISFTWHAPRPIKKGVYTVYNSTYAELQTDACLVQHFLVPGAVLVEEFGGRVLEGVLRLGQLNQLQPVPGRMLRPPRVRTVRWLTSLDCWKVSFFTHLDNLIQNNVTSFHF